MKIMLVSIKSTGTHYVMAVPLLSGTNFLSWKEAVKFNLGVMDLDICFRISKPKPDDEGYDEEDYALWEKSNRLSLNYMLQHIPRDFRGPYNEDTLAVEYMAQVEGQFVSADKSIGGSLIDKFANTRYDGKGNIREHIMFMRDVTGKLRELDIIIPESFLVHFLMQTLPPSYEAFKIAYNSHKDIWSISELMTQCVQEEERQRSKGKEVNMVNMSITPSTNSYKKSKRQDKKLGVKSNTKKVKCFFCKKAGHLKKDCVKRKEWFQKKGIYTLVTCNESHLASVPNNSWWIDSGATVHISTTLQGFLSRRLPSESERFVVSGNRQRSHVKAVGDFKISLDNEDLILKNCFYVSSFQRNLISVSRLVKDNCSVLFNASGMSLFWGNTIVGNAIFDELFRLKTSSSNDNLSFNVNPRKRKEVRNDSGILWHKILGHISQKRVEKLVKEGLLGSLDFTSFPTCVNCIKAKATNTFKKNAIRAQSSLELIHTDICGPFDPCYTGQRYFITFIDDFSRYMYLYLIHEKSESLKMFKDFKIEAEKQLGKPIKMVRSDRGGEYYGRYTEYGQMSGPFALFLQEHGIVPQYTMPGKPNMNGVAERRNRTLKEMVRAMMNHSTLPNSMWGEAIKTAVHILNRVPTKAIKNVTPYELWTNKKPCLTYMHIWGCPAEVKIYNPHERSLDSRTVSGYFIGYPERSRGYRFYCPSHSMRIVESDRAFFLEDDCVSGSTLRDFVFEESHEDIITSHKDQLENSEVSPQEETMTYVPKIVPLQRNTQIGISSPQEHTHVQTHEQLIPENVLDPSMDETHEGEQNIVRRSSRERRSAISSDYFVYLAGEDLGQKSNDPLTFSQAISCTNSYHWLQAMKEELSSMDSNHVWEIVDLPSGKRAIGCKWIYKTKLNPDGSEERYKARLVAKGFTQREGIDYYETFAPVSSKDSFRIVMALVAHFNLELHQMDVKTAFLNGELNEEVYMKQPEGFEIKGKEHMVCKLKRSIYGLKQASRQWYFKFNEVIMKFGFKENIVDQCIYLKKSGSAWILLDVG